MEYLGYMFVVIFAIAISPVLKGFVNKFVEEDRLEEEAERKKEIQKDSKKKSRKEEIKQETQSKTKVKFIPEFDWKVTAVTVLAEVILFLVFGITAEFFIYAFLTLLLIICTFSDIKGCIIPNEINFLGFIVGSILTFYKMIVNVETGLDSIAGAIIGLLIFLGIAGLSLLLYKKEGMGGGDIKLMGVLGLYVGFANNIQIFILSFFLAAIISLTLIATKKKKSDDYIPFGPFIVLAAYITILFPASVTMPAVLQFLS